MEAPRAHRTGRDSFAPLVAPSSPSTLPQTSKFVFDHDMSQENVSRAPSTLQGEDAVVEKAESRSPRGLRFWLIIFSICISCFLSALEYVGAPAFLLWLVPDQMRSWFHRLLCRPLFRPSSTTFTATTSYGWRQPTPLLLRRFCLQVADWHRLVTCVYSCLGQSI